MTTTTPRPPDSTPRSGTRTVLVFAVLAVVMAVTRLHHFGAVPDASWAVFFVAGFQLRGALRWAFPALMAMAVAVDWLVITGQGISFWQHYCVSPAYWCLIPAYFALWAGGSWLRARIGDATGLRALGTAAAALLVSVALCHLIAQGSFYWISASVAQPTLAGWWVNYTDWLGPYLAVAAMYVGIAAAIHVAVVRLAPATRAPTARP
ncbi:MAG: hypothetical protein ACREO8_14450 [Luteimonas sp.]